MFDFLSPELNQKIEDYELTLIVEAVLSNKDNLMGIDEAAFQQAFSGRDLVGYMDQEITTNDALDYYGIEEADATEVLLTICGNNISMSVVEYVVAQIKSIFPDINVTFTMAVDPGYELDKFTVVAVFAG